MKCRVWIDIKKFYYVKRKTNRSIARKGIQEKPVVLKKEKAVKKREENGWQCILFRKEKRKSMIEYMECSGVDSYKKNLIIKRGKQKNR